MPNNKKSAGEVAERLKILEKAVSSLADTLKRRDDDIDEEVRDIFLELKALKLFLSRNTPEFKKQFPEIQRKLK
jgi:hypothetical protein